MRGSPAALLSVAALLLPSACTNGNSAEPPTAPAAAGIEAADGAGTDAPVPVEGEGGIGGEARSGPVSSSLLLDGDRVALAGACRAAAPESYRLELVDGGRLTVTPAGASERVRLEWAAATYLPRAGEPVSIQQAADAVVVQGIVTADGAGEAFVDATIGTEELPAC